METYTCPVCGYDKLDEPPKRWSICPSCGTEFEYSDSELSHSELRQIWIDGGMAWWSHSDNVPPDWNPAEQLKNVVAHA